MRAATYRRRLAGMIAVATIGLVAGCGSNGPAPTSGSGGLRGSITVFAAASLTGSFQQLGRQFEAAHPGTRVTFSFGSSSTLAQQIDQGAPADVFASAAEVNMNQVVTAGDIAASSTFASNTAEIAVAPDEASRITSITDLGKPGVSVALCQVQVPCGALAQKVLGNAHVDVSPKTRGLDVKSTLQYVTTGQVDAAIVYVTDVQAAGASVVGVPVPTADNAKTEYPIGVVSASSHRALAQAFVAYVESAAGRSVLAAAGFGGP